MVLAAAMPLTAPSMPSSMRSTASLCGMVTLSPRNPNSRASLNEAFQVFAGNAEGRVDLIQLVVPECRVVHQRAEAVADGVADHAVDFGLGVDAVVVVQFLHVEERELPGGQLPLVVERGVRERRSEAASQNPRRHADVAHAQPRRSARRCP